MTTSFKISFARAFAVGAFAVAIVSPAMALQPTSLGAAGAWSRCELDCKNTYPDNPVLKRACIKNCQTSGSVMGGVGGAGYTVLAPPPSTPKPPKVLDFKSTAGVAGGLVARK